MLEDNKKIAKDVIDLALGYGTEQVSVSLAKSISFQVDVRENKIESLQESGSSGIHITISKNNRRSTVSSNDFREEGINKVLLANVYQQIVPSNESSNKNYRDASQVEFDAKNNLALANRYFQLP